MTDQPTRQQAPRKVPAAAFYDEASLKRLRPDQEVPQRPKRQARRQQFNPLQAPYRTFKTQAAAFEFLDAQACSSILRTFAVETAETGQRDFIVASAQLFWQTYAAAKKRHHYEIIRQGSPCNLYFDLEYCPEVNSGHNGPRLVELLVTGVRELLQELYGVRLEDQHVLELDSSTPSKFSRHLIVRLPGLAFADACHAGRFARVVLLRLLAKGAHCSSYGHFLVRNKDGGLTSFVDMGVYTRNRAFRLYLSSKFGKAAVLRLTHRFGGPSRCPEAAFHDALVSVLLPSAGARTITHHQQVVSSDCDRSGGSSTEALVAASGASRHEAGSPSTERSSADGGDDQVAPAAGLTLLYMETDGQQELLQLPPSWQQLPMLQLRPLEHARPGAPTAADRSQAPPCLSSLHRQGFRPGTAPGASGALAASWSCQPFFGPSPFPALDAFMTSVVCAGAGAQQAGIRSWLLQPPGCVVFNIKGNRWCDNVGRAHRSNGIFYCVDLSAGVYYQKCYDPECRHYRSNLMPLPTDVWHAYKHLAAPPGGSSDQGPSRQQQQQDQQQQGHHQQQDQQVQAVGAAAAAAAAAAEEEEEEDEECLTLLLQCEQQQRQQQAHTHGHCRHQQKQQVAEHACPRQGSCTAAGPTQHSTVCASIPAPCPALQQHLQDDCDMELQEDELCMQLLQDVEQQHLSGPRGLAVG